MTSFLDPVNGKTLLVAGFFGGPSCDTRPSMCWALEGCHENRPKLHILIETPFSVIVLRCGVQKTLGHFFRRFFLGVVKLEG